MKIELHIIQNFPVHCLNRDDANNPKECVFGGVRRARISSQSFKRAMRDYFAVEEVLAPQHRAVRTKRLVGQLADRLEASGHDRAEAMSAAVEALSWVKLKVPTKKNEERKTQYLVYLPMRDIDALAELLHEHWVDIKKKGKSQKTLQAKVTSLLAEAEQTPELALFGRMIADNPDWNMEASCQVAHAISTHRIEMEYDFFTAVDDLKPDDTSGSDMMGVIPFNSACFYRYAALNVDELASNLGDGSEELTKKTVEAFLRGFVCAVPSGKQNSMASKTMPSYILAVVRQEGQAWMLSNAFVKPVRAGKHGQPNLIGDSIDALQGHLSEHERMYGTDGIRLALACAMKTPDNSAGGGTIKFVDGFEALVKDTIDAAFEVAAA